MAITPPAALIGSVAKSDFQKVADDLPVVVAKRSLAPPFRKLLFTNTLDGQGTALIGGPTNGIQTSRRGNLAKELGRFALDRSIAHDAVVRR